MISYNVNNVARCGEDEILASLVRECASLLSESDVLPPSTPPRNPPSTFATKAATCVVTLVRPSIATLKSIYD